MTTAFQQSRFIVGIDLGTTNTAVSCVDLEKNTEIRHLNITQLIAPGELGTSPLLPSFCYLPSGKELPEGSLELPWDRQSDYAVGVFAREQSGAVPGRVVASSKSWLAHGGVDRTAGILPWHGDVKKPISPVEAARRTLKHIRDCWNHHYGKQKDNEGSYCLLEDQLVVLTVPASFDEVARELTIQAARQAGYSKLVLLEEPMAAFYSWLQRHEENWDNTLTPGQTVLVVDAGGGTTDFSLITIEEDGVLRRTAVGDHLLLGGDNIDMALGRKLEAEWKAKLSVREWSMLCRQCCKAKETLLSDKAPAEVSVVLAGSGSSLIGGSRKGTLKRDDVQQLVLDGFFPRVSTEEPPPKRRGGVREMGLPYVADPAATRHLLDFLKRSAPLFENSDSLPKIDWILFNGGTLLPKVIRTHIAATLGNWVNNGIPVAELKSKDLNLAVSDGASYYGLVRYGKGVRVKGGIARSYYIEVATEAGPKLVCLVPRDADEGVKLKLEGLSFQVAANTPVRFPLFASSTRLGDKPGELVDNNNDDLTALPPLQTVLNYGSKSDHRLLDVHLEATLNEVGSLDLHCVTKDNSKSFPLSFDLRSEQSSTETEQIIEQEKITAALLVFEEILQDKKRLPSLLKQLEKSVGLSRKEWGISLLRQFADKTLELSERRTTSAEFEARWLNIAGFSMRPGFGAPADDWRIKEIWKLRHAGTTFSKPVTRAEWWIFWRRVSGGLNTGRQDQIASPLIKELLPKGVPLVRKGKGASQEEIEKWRCLGALERIDAGRKRKIMRALLSVPTPLEDHHFQVIARLGARRLFYGPHNTIIPAENINKLTARLLSLTEKNPNRPALLAVSSLTCLSGQREFDVAEKHRTRAHKLLKQHNAPNEWIERIESVHKDSRDFQAEVTGDTLPLGLILVTE